MQPLLWDDCSEIGVGFNSAGWRMQRTGDGGGWSPLAIPSVGGNRGISFQAGSANRQTWSTLRTRRLGSPPMATYHELKRNINASHHVIFWVQSGNAPLHEWAKHQGAPYRCPPSPMLVRGHPFSQPHHLGKSASSRSRRATCNEGCRHSCPPRGVPRDPARSECAQSLHGQAKGEPERDCPPIPQPTHGEANRSKCTMSSRIPPISPFTS